MDSAIDFPLHAKMPYTCYSVIEIIGIIGNFLFILIVARKKSMQTSLNIFLTRIAIADEILCVIFAVYDLNILFAVPGYNLFFCQINEYLGLFAGLFSPVMFASTFITFAFVKEISDRKRCQLISAVCALAMIYAIPHGYFSTVVSLHNGGLFCSAEWSSEKNKEIYYLVANIIESLALLSSLIVCIIKHTNFRSASSKKTISRQLPLLLLIFTALIAPYLLDRLVKFDKFFSYSTLETFICVSFLMFFSFKPIFYF